MRTFFSRNPVVSGERIAVLLLISLLLLTDNTAMGQTVADLQQRADGFSAALNQRDLAVLRAYYLNTAMFDADLVPQNGRITQTNLQGTDAIIDYWSKLQVSKIEIKVTQMRVTPSGYVVERSDFKLSTSDVNPRSISGWRTVLWAPLNGGLRIEEEGWDDEKYCKRTDEWTLSCEYP
jgi:hypothetical protein